MSNSTSLVLKDALHARPLPLCLRCQKPVEGFITYDDPSSRDIVVRFRCHGWECEHRLPNYVMDHLESCRALLNQLVEPQFDPKQWHEMSGTERLKALLDKGIHEGRIQAPLGYTTTPLPEPKYQKHGDIKIFPI